MSFSGALGRGTYQSVISGTRHSAAPSYHHCAGELVRLLELHRNVQTTIAIRDAVFQPRFPEAAKLAGTYRLTPRARREWHTSEVMRQIRKRSILLTRLRQQRRINAKLDAPAASPSPDAAVYFAPAQATAVNSWPNFWQHGSRRHVIPAVEWERRADLGGITRTKRQPHEYGITF